MENIIESADPDLNHYNDTMVNFKSYTPETFRGCIESKGALNILHQNVRSILKEGRKDEIDIMLNTINNPFHILAYTETWLKPENVGLVNFSEYEHVSNIRPTDQFFDMKEMGGGVSLFIKNNIQYKVREDLNIMSSYMETLFIEIPHNGKTYIIGVIYRVPNTQVASFNETLNALIEPIRNNYEVILVGDFNICLINDDNRTQSFRHVLQSNSLFPTILEPTRVATVLRNGNYHVTKTLIDNIFINNSLNHKSGLIVSPISDHYPIFISLINDSLEFQDTAQEIKYRLIDDFRIRKFKSALTQSFNNSIIHFDTAPEAFTNFLLNFDQLYNKYFPIITKKLSRKSILKPWVSESLVRKIKIKSNLLKLSTKGIVDRDIYTRFRNSLTTQLRQAKASHYDKEFDKCEGNVKKTWNIINANIKNRIKNNKISIQEENRILDSSELPNKFNNYFSNIANELVSNIPQDQVGFKTFLKNRLPNSFYMYETSNQEIIDAINGLKSCNGINQISTTVLKEIDVELSHPLLHIYNLCIKEGYFPTELKLGCITPIFKKGDKYCISNYRPVCSLSPFSKIFERILYNRMLEFIGRNDIFSDTQYGFRKKKSAETALLDFTNYIYEGLSAKQNVGSIFMDLSKAFDVIDHSILETKLEHYGFRGIFLTLLMNFVRNRRYFVSVNGIKSDINTVNIGVPQGSTLGPLLFLIYINNMKNSSDLLKFIQFADDTTLMYRCNCILQLNNILETEGEKVTKWLTANRLIINLTKTHTMLFSNKLNNPTLQLKIHDTILEDKAETCFLGVIIDKKLTWKQHIQHISDKISKTVALLRLLRYIFPKRILKLIYLSLIYSYLNYCNVIWGGAYDTVLQPLYILQKKAIRLITSSHYLEHTAPLFKSLELLNIHQIFKLNCLLLVYKCTKNNYFMEFKNKLHSNSSIHSYNTRINSLLRLPSDKQKLIRKSYLCKSIELWNTVDVDIRNINSITVFKKKIKILLIENKI